jgi:hypothetical protein
MDHSYQLQIYPEIVASYEKMNHKYGYVYPRPPFDDTRYVFLLVYAHEFSNSYLLFIASVFLCSALIYHHCDFV